jgi:hypothetical protein
MDDTQFRMLELSIEHAMNRLDRLQEMYRKETGKDFIRPPRPAESWVRAQEQLDRDEAKNRQHDKPSRESSYDIAADGGQGR